MVKEVFFYLCPFSHGPDPKQPNDNGGRGACMGQNFLFDQWSYSPYGQIPTAILLLCSSVLPLLGPGSGQRRREEEAQESDAIRWFINFWTHP